MAHEDIIELIQQQDEISDDAAEAIIEALARKVPLVERDEPERLTSSSGGGSRIHTHVSSLTSSDAWTCFLWIQDANAALGHIPAHMACLRETFAHSVGQDYLELALERQRARAARAAATLEVDEQPPEEPRQ